MSNRGKSTCKEDSASPGGGPLERSSSQGVKDTNSIFTKLAHCLGLRTAKSPPQFSKFLEIDQIQCASPRIIDRIHCVTVSRRAITGPGIRTSKFQSFCHRVVCPIQVRVMTGQFLVLIFDQALRNILVHALLYCTLSSNGVIPFYRTGL